MHYAVEKFPIHDKVVFLRVDFNVPIRAGRIVDNTKIRASLPTIKFLLKRGCSLVIGTHVGRPKGKIVKSLRVKIVVDELERLMVKEFPKKIIPMRRLRSGKKSNRVEISVLNSCLGNEIREKIHNSKGEQGQKIFVFENLRFFKEEKENNRMFAHCLADMADVYVNDAFGVIHRKHASVHRITEFLPSYSGLLVEKELFELRRGLHGKKPRTWLLGGAKLHKVELIESALKQADYVLVGGALAFAFLKAQGVRVGMSRGDAESVRMARKVLKMKEAYKIILPVDFVVAKKIDKKALYKNVNVSELGESWIGLDLGSKTVELFKQYLRKAHTVVWNGPLGYYELPQFAKSTKEIGRYIGTLTAVSICGGGETGDVIRKFGLEHKMSHVSTGGGASLAYLSGKELVGIKALERSAKKMKKVVRFE